jgi:hypothetical protein
VLARWRLAAARLFDESGKLAISRASSNSPSIITYQGYDQARGAFVDNYDFCADGTVDFRTTEVPGHDVKRESHVGERWLEVVHHDSVSGVIFNGRFMSVADAVKLSDKAAHIEGK